MINLLSRRKDGDWSGYRCFKCYRDGLGEQFDCPKYVVFDGQELVAEESSQTRADLAFKRGDRVEDGVRLRDYLGVDNRIRNG
jgi:hypothetical protein